MEMRRLINVVKNYKQFVNEQEADTIKIYHGVPFKNSADGIKKNGLQQVGDFVPVGGDGSPSIKNRSYVAKELWNAVRYSFMKPDSINMEWNNYIKKEPYSFVFEFDIPINELLPDEDAIGAGVSEYLNKGNNNFYQKYLSNLDGALLNKVKEGNFNAFAQIGKIIEPKLSIEDKKNVIKHSLTATIDKPIFPSKSYIFNKPNVQFFKNKEEYLNWFNEYHKQY
jgi:hypothetical protein